MCYYRECPGCDDYSCKNNKNDKNKNIKCENNGVGYNSGIIFDFDDDVESFDEMFYDGIHDDFGDH